VLLVISLELEDVLLEIPLELELELVDNESLDIGTKVSLDDVSEVCDDDGIEDNVRDELELGLWVEDDIELDEEAEDWNVHGATLVFTSTAI
jgi:hypothetical protein